MEYGLILCLGTYIHARRCSAFVVKNFVHQPAGGDLGFCLVSTH